MDGWAAKRAVPIEDRVGSHDEFGSVTFDLGYDSLPQHPCLYCGLDCRTEDHYHVHKKTCSKREAHFKKQMEKPGKLCSYCSLLVEDYQGHKSKCEKRQAHFARMAEEEARSSGVEADRWQFEFCLRASPQETRRLEGVAKTLSDRHGGPDICPEVVIVDNIDGGESNDEFEDSLVVTACAALAAASGDVHVVFGKSVPGSRCSVRLEVTPSPAISAMSSRALELLREHAQLECEECVPSMPVVYCISMGEAAVAAETLNQPTIRGQLGEGYVGKFLEVYKYCDSAANARDMVASRVLMGRFALGK